MSSRAVSLVNKIIACGIFSSVVLVSGGAEADSGMGNYICIQSLKEPNAVYMVTTLNNAWGAAVRVSSTEAISDKELNPLSLQVDNVLDNKEQRRNLEQANQLVIGKYTLEPIQFSGGSRPSQFTNAKYKIDVGPNNYLSIILKESPRYCPQNNPGAKCWAEKMVSIYEGRFERNGDRDRQTDDNGLGKKFEIRGQRFPNGSNSTEPLGHFRFCGYWHES